MRILITGGAGFIGSHLCERLIAKATSYLPRQFFTGPPGKHSAFTRQSSLELLRHDVIEPILLEVTKFTTGCPASPVQLPVQPVRQSKTNVMGAINMLGLAKRVRRDPAASTSEFMAIRSSIHRLRNTGAQRSNPIGCVPVMTKASGWQKR